MTETWQDLVYRAQNEDLSAFGELYDLYYKKVYSYAYYRLNSSEDAEDIAAQTFLKALEALKSYDKEKSAFITWLITITSRLIIDLYRSRGRSLEVPIGPVEGDTTGYDMEDDVVERLSSQFVRDALRHITEEQRQVILLKFGMHLQNGEIALIMDKTEGAVKALQHRALGNLKRVVMSKQAAELAELKDATVSEL